MITRAPANGNDLGTDLPHYRLPWRVAYALGRDALFGQPRVFAADCAAMVRQLRPPPVVLGHEHIPASGPFALVANHYEGPGMWIGWSAALLTDTVAAVRGPRLPLHWLVIGDMDRRRVDGVKRFAPLTGWFFGRIARAWELAALPRPDAPPAARAAALRRLVGWARAGEAVAFFPEGEGEGFAGLRPAQPGGGALLALLARQGAPALPAGVWAEGGRLHARFGPPWRPTGRDDAALGAEAIGRIGALLPPALAGTVAKAISGERR